ncbi:uncharacterized protein LY89DRAFT_737451 [Mollisia scopiformis]|uniref:Uncharacterized protein n=1 Tax=Mollisia scopiformis TaxID=149040 RepID=A0A194WZU9_MOLSC|nr:uncharacterized protein LY89DRAFT_737451 [Mollisia scopiformis]KUJ13471.1 hypothetical protein LY89DRAFT_737451 [Mollisia scopiformis]
MDMIKDHDSQRGGAIVVPKVVDPSLFFEFGDDRYVAWPDVSELKLHFLTEHSSVTVISLPQGRSIDTDWLEAHITESLELDDVLREDFLQTILLAGPGTEQLSSIQPFERLTNPQSRTWKIKRIESVGWQSGLLPGPYIVVGDQLWQVLRLYDDTQGAFLAPVRKSIHGRDLTKLSNFADKWYTETKPRTKQKELPMAIVVPIDLFPTADTPQKRLVLKLVEDLEKHLKVEAQRVSISGLWDDQPPQAAAGESLQDYLREVGANTFLYENYHSTANFRDDYRKKFGRAPFSSPFVTWRWKIGKQYTAEQHEEGMRRMKTYAEWFLDTVMQVGTANTAYYIQPAWHQWWISPILGAPEIVVPVGQLPYESRISNQTEYLPVTASIMSQPGTKIVAILDTTATSIIIDTDMTLIEFTETFMKDVGRSLVVQSGKIMFPL